MIAIGCIAPIILGVAGVIGGNAVAGSAGAIWGGIGGLVLGGLVLAAVGWMVERLKS